MRGGTQVQVVGSFVVIVALILASSVASLPVPGRLRAGPGIMSRPPAQAVAAGLFVGLATMLQVMHAAGAAAHHPDVAAAVGDDAVVLVAARADARATRTCAARTTACGGRVGAELAAGLFIDVERWHALVVMLSLPWQSVVGLSSEPSLSRAWVRLWPRHEEGYRTVSVSYSLPDSQLLAALGTYLVVHDGHAEATRRGASGCWRGDAAATSGGGACACVWAV